MITFTTNAAKVAKNIRALEERIRTYREDFLNWAQRSYHRRARLIVRTVVYGAYSPSVYRRTGRLRRSIRVNRTHRVAEMLRKAFRIATTGRPGPVQIQYYSEVFNDEYPMEIYGEDEFTRYPAMNAKKEKSTPSRSLPTPSGV